MNKQLLSYRFVFFSLLFCLALSSFVSAQQQETYIKLEEAFSVPLQVSDVLSTQPATVPTVTPMPEITPVAGITPLPTPVVDEAKKEQDRQIAAKLEEVQNFLNRGREEEAKTILKEIAEKYPDSKYAAQSLYLLGGRLETDIPNAIEYLHKVIVQYPNTIWAGLALYKISESYFILGNYVECEKNLIDYLKNKWDVQFREKAYRSLLSVQLKLQKFGQAKTTLTQIWDEFPKLKKEPSLSESFGEILYELKDYKGSLDVYNKLILNYPAYPSLSRIYLNKGFCHESLNENDKALSTYEEIAKLFPQTIESDLAQIRIKDLKSPLFREAETTAAADTPSTSTLIIIENETPIEEQKKDNARQKEYKNRDF